MSEQHGTAQRPRRLATVALALAILPFPLGWVPAFALAAVVLFLASRGLEGGRGRAAAALVISSLWILGAVVAGVVVYAVNAPDETATADVQPESPGSTDVRPDGDPDSDDVVIVDLHVGDCVLHIGDNAVDETLPVVPCSHPHEAEVYGVFDVAKSKNVTQDEIDRRADGGCTRRFAEFIGVSYSNSRYEITWYDPTPENIGDNASVICLVDDPDRDTKGSLKGSAR